MIVDDSRWSTLGENLLHLVLEVCNRPLYQGTRCARDLGVIFDDQLTFSDHTVKTVSSCMSNPAKSRGRLRW